MYYLVLSNPDSIVVEVGIYTTAMGDDTPYGDDMWHEMLHYAADAK